jgi:hypothetical protein
MPGMVMIIRADRSLASSGIMRRRQPRLGNSGSLRKKRAVRCVEINSGGAPAIDVPFQRAFVGAGWPSKRLHELSKGCVGTAAYQSFIGGNEP